MVGRSKKPINFWTAVRLETNSAFEFSNIEGFLNLCKTMHEKTGSKSLMWVEKSIAPSRYGQNKYRQRVLIPELSEYDMNILRDFGYPCRYVNMSRRVRKQLYKRLIL